MARQNESKLNLYLSQLPSDVVLPSVWLNQQGVSRKLIWWYVHTGWLEKLASKAYRKTGGKLCWEGALYALQHYLQLPMHIGGKTALMLLGRIHYVPVAGIKQIFLFTEPHIAIPAWVEKNAFLQEKFILIKTDLFCAEKRAALISREFLSHKLSLSAPERAILEVMHLVPKYTSYEEAILLMENLSNLRPNVVQKVLDNCKSIKAKRLFLHAASLHQHSWLNEINLRTIALGTGKRKIGEGGIYDSKYQLSVPPLKTQNGEPIAINSLKQHKKLQRVKIKYDPTTPLNEDEWPG